MRQTLERGGNFLATSANRISLVWAIRGTISTAVPLLLLPLFGMGVGAHIAAVGALNTSMVDGGGTYRGRFNAMALNVVLSPVSLAIGSAVQEWWWLAALLMFVIALGSGLLRAIGPNGTPLGLFVGLAFLVGTNLTTDTRGIAAAAVLYFLGGAWTILVALLFWRLRPFKRVEQEVATVWESTAQLAAAVRLIESDGASVVQRRQQERVFAQRHQNLRAAVERARAALGMLRGEITGPGVMFAQLFILIRSASRIAAAVVTLRELREHEARPLAARTHSASERAARDLDQACRAVAASLLSHRRKLSLADLRQHLDELAADLGPSAPEVLALAQAQRNLENAGEAMILLLGSGTGLLLLPPLASKSPPGRAISAIRAQLSLGSAIFRHALRVALASAVATAILLRLELPHGVWLPMTALAVLQPEFGGTWTRALERTAGTAGGAVIAGVLLSTLHGSLGLELALTGLLFVAFFVQRRRRGLGITFLTPLIVLLLATSMGSPWLDTLSRVLYTIAGAALALFAGYVLWPEWERERVPEQLARAIRANRNYMQQVLAALGGGQSEALGELRRQAEIATGNAEAGFQRLLTEPRRQRGRVTLAFALVTYVQRLERHLIALQGYIGAAKFASAEVGELAARLGRSQDEIAAAISEGRAPEPCGSLDEPLAQVTAQFAAAKSSGPESAVSFLLARLVSDTRSLHHAAEMK